MTLFNRPKQPKKYAVIGQLEANALEKERQRIAEGPPVPSPMPQGDYDYKERQLLIPSEAQLDRELKSVIKLFPSLTKRERTIFRKRISHHEFYTLLTFAKRSAVFALREKNPEILRYGFGAIAMIEVERVDYRDIFCTLGLLSHSAQRIGVDYNREISILSELAEPGGVRNLLLGFSQSLAKDKDKDIAISWGFKEIDTPPGPGYVYWGFNRYNPTTDLLHIALEIAELLEKDKYEADCPILAEGFPIVWFWNKSSDAKTELDNINGVVTIHGRLRAEFDTSERTQIILIFLVETKSPLSAARLSHIGRLVKPETYGKPFGILAIDAARLFCLVVAESDTMGVDSYETSDSLRRFEPGIEYALKKVTDLG